MFILKVLCVMTIFSTTASFSAENSPPKIAIVGAGLAGLTAAHRLQQKGMDVDLYEARSRVGGRVLTVKIGDDIAELGGHSISDGGGAENILRLMEEFGLELAGGKINVTKSAYFTGDKLISLEQMLEEKHFHPESLKVQLETLAQKSKNMREVLNGILEEEDPLYKILAVRLAGYEGASVDELSPLYVETLYHMLLGGLSAVHTANGEEETQLKFMSINGGNAQLPDRLALTLGKKLHLGQQLKKVSKGSNNAFLLTFQDNQTAAADILVLAIPCSVYEEIVFEENILPSQKLEDIKSVHYGTNAKMLVPFSKPPSNKMGFTNDHMGCFFDVDYRVLTLYYTGAASRFSKETILESYRLERPMLEMGYKDACPPFIAPVYANDESFAVYDRPVGYSWPNDPYVKGSYAYIAPGQETLLTAIQQEQGELVKTLFAPIDQKIYFAGEHASILLDAPGTMEAACESGERAARMIINCMVHK